MNGSDLKTPHGASVTDVQSAESWEEIDWHEAEKHVNRIQAKIAKAATEGNLEKVRRLQRLLTSSHRAKLLAVRTVTTNKGKSTPGVDHVLWSTPESKLRAADELEVKGYKAMPLRRVNIPKKGKRGKTRPLGIPTMQDRAMQALFAMALEPVAEATGDRHSYGFRKGRSAQDACEQAFEVLAAKMRAKWVLEGDIKGCFDNISHEWLMENIPMDKKVLSQFLKAGYMEKGTWHETSNGTPQGGIISPILANMALDGLDGLLDGMFHTAKSGRTSKAVTNRNKVNLVRYADDFIVTAIDESTAARAKAAIEAFLLERGLKLSAEKTLVTHIDDGFDFLGWNFRKYDGKLIIKPSKKAVDAFLRDIHETMLRRGKQWTQEVLVRTLTPKIRGFANYHRHICAAETFRHIDYCIFQMLRRWTKRRHPNWGYRRLRQKYWFTLGGCHYVFGTYERYLPFMGWQKIVRHPLLKCGENPYANPEYFTNRREQIKKRYAGSFHTAAVRNRTVRDA